jgi:hypothetical protein
VSFEPFRRLAGRWTIWWTSWISRGQDLERPEHPTQVCCENPQISPIDKSERVHPSLRSVIRVEGMGSRVADSIVEEGEGSDMFEVPGAGPLRKSSDIAGTLVKS